LPLLLLHGLPLPFEQGSPGGLLSVPLSSAVVVSPEARTIAPPSTRASLAEPKDPAARSISAACVGEESLPFPTPDKAPGAMSNVPSLTTSAEFLTEPPAP
jgi:hypothetical protein